MILASARQYCGRADNDAEAIVLNGTMPSTLMRYMQLQEQKKQSDKYSKKLEIGIQRLKAILAAEMGTSCKAVCDMDGSRYTLTYNPVRKMIVDKDNLARLKLQYPEIYEQFVTVSEFRTFHVKCSGQVFLQHLLIKIIGLLPGGYRNGQLLSMVLRTAARSCH